MCARAKGSPFSLSASGGVCMAHGVRSLKQPVLLPYKDVHRLLSYDEVMRILHYKPQHLIDGRTWTLILFLLDTGVRIDEALRVEHTHVNLERLCVKVLGKGNKERTVPMTDVMRRVLYR